MPSGDILELNDVLYVPDLKKKILSISCMANFQCSVAFEGQQCTINDCSLASQGTLARGVRDGGLYKSFVDPMVLVHTSRKLGKQSMHGVMPWR